MEAPHMTSNEEFVRNAYATAEAMDIQGWINSFTPDGVFVDNSIAVTYRGPGEVAKPVEYYGAAFSDMHRELYHVYTSGDVVGGPARAAGHTRRRATSPFRHGAANR